MKLLDSCAWVEVLADGPLARVFHPLVLAAEETLVPTVVLSEVFRWMRRVGGEERAVLAAAHMREGTVAPLTDRVALLAAELADEYRLSMTDAFVYAHARVAGATVVTSNAHFEGLPGVQYHPKRSVTTSPPGSPEPTA